MLGKEFIQNFPGFLYSEKNRNYIKFKTNKKNFLCNVMNNVRILLYQLVITESSQKSPKMEQPFHTNYNNTFGGVFKEDKTVRVKFLDIKRGVDEEKNATTTCTGFALNCYRLKGVITEKSIVSQPQVSCRDY